MICPFCGQEHDNEGDRYGCPWCLGEGLEEEEKKDEKDDEDA